MDTKTFTLDLEAREQLERYLDSENLTQPQVAKRLGFHPSRINKYLRLNQPGHIPEPDAGKVQQAVINFFRHLKRISQKGESLFQNEISREVETALLQIQRTGDIGLIHGDAGLGKTCAAELFCANNPNTILVTITRWARDAAAVQGLIFEECSPDERPGRVRRGTYIANQLRGSERLIIVDNAHRLHISAFEWLTDLNDSTQSPIALIGNPSVLMMLRRSDQLYSRVGMVRRVSFKREESETARRLIKAVAPEQEAALLTEGRKIVTQGGHARTLVKQLALAREIIVGKPSLRWEDAFMSAGALLIKPGSGLAIARQETEAP